MTLTLTLTRGWLGGVRAMPDLGELQSDLDETGEQQD